MTSFLRALTFGALFVACVVAVIPPDLDLDDYLPYFQETYEKRGPGGGRGGGNRRDPSIINGVNITHYFDVPANWPELCAQEALVPTDPVGLLNYQNRALNHRTDMMDYIVQQMCVMDVYNFAFRETASGAVSSGAVSDIVPLIPYFLLLGISFPDLTTTTEMVTVQDNEISMVVRYWGTFTESFMGIPATSEKISFISSTHQTIRDGKVVAEQGINNFMAAL